MRFPMVKRVPLAVLALLVALGAAVPMAQTPGKTAQPKITTPKEQFGHDIGDDYFLVNYTQYVEYLRKMDKESDRMTVVEIGKSEEGRPELTRSEEHTSELQSPCNLVCRLLLEKKK